MLMGKDYKNATATVFRGVEVLVELVRQGSSQVDDIPTAEHKPPAKCVVCHG